MCEFDYPKTIQMRSYNPVVKGHLGQIKKAVQMLHGSQAPDHLHRRRRHSFRCGTQQLTELAHKLNFPVTNTLMGLGGYPATDRQFVGMLGMHGTYEANKAMHYADVMLAIGARFDDRVIGNPEHFGEEKRRKIIHIDIDPSSISKRVKVDVPIVGNVADVLDEMLKLVDGGFTADPEVAELVETDRRMARS